MPKAFLSKIPDSLELINRHREAHLDWSFLTLAFCEIQAEVLPRNIAKKYSAKVLSAKLARLVVSKKHQRNGFGKI